MIYLSMLLPAKNFSLNEILFLIKKLKDGKSSVYDLITKKVHISILTHPIPKSHSLAQEKIPQRFTNLK